MNHIDAILKHRRILITCGTGGVGKTTLSAAIALRAAMLGKKTVVVTIDPAKRLATSLGLTHLGDDPTDLTPLIQKAAGNKPVPGSLDAIMPDTRKTFEAFVEALSPSRAVTERVIRNPIFQILAKEFSGTNEYMALQRLYTLDHMRKYDCIILDTPPSRNTLAFLRAPNLLGQFFEDKIIKWLVLPTNRLVSGGIKKALSVLEKLTGAGFMVNLFDFAAALFDVRANFSKNLKTIEDLLQSEAVGFLMVSNASPDTADEATHFIQTVREHKFHFDGVVLNRTLGYLKVTEDERAEARKDENLGKALEVLEALQIREDRSIELLLKKLSGKTCAKLPELARDVHSVKDLFHVAEALESGTD